MNLFQSSSLHTINADKPLTTFKKRMWWLCNRLNNACFPGVVFSNRIEIMPFTCDVSEQDWLSLPPKSSPSRVFSDLFWMKLPWGRIQNTLNEIQVYDIGCGHGRYSTRLKDYSDNRITSYTGVDVKPSKAWETLAVAQHHFIVAENTKNVVNLLDEKMNLIVSQSVLEHIEDDIILFKGIRDWIKQNRREVIQVHLVPSEVCLEMYPYHGVRQYSSRTLSQISRYFLPFSKVYIFKLGGMRSYQLHLNYITQPLKQNGVDLRDEQSEMYYNILKKSIIDDMYEHKGKPSFYALVIHSYPHVDL